MLAYVRTPIEGTDAMRTWLAAYAPLLARLPEPGLVLVTTSDDEAAESVAVAHAVLRATTIDTTPTVAEWRAQMEEYLEARRRLDQGDRMRPLRRITLPRSAWSGPASPTMSMRPCTARIGPGARPCCTT